MDEKLLIKAKLLKASGTVAEVLSELGDVPYGVLKGESGELLALLSVDELRSINSNEPIQTFIANQSRPLTVDLQLELDKVVQGFAQDFVAHPDRGGLIVQDKGEVKGILPRKTIVEQALRIVSRRSIDRLEGAPLDVMIFECTEDPERKILDYYDSANPPKCSKGHEMKLLED
jgi:hypothetical protein